MAEAEVIEATGREVVATNGHSAPLALIQGSPTEVIDRATAMADKLRDVINSRKLYADIQGKKHVTVEGWTTLGALVGVFPIVEWSKPIIDQDNETVGWEARVEARTVSGQTIGAAEAQCTRSERSWKDRDDYALRSMAQTRATSKAMRLPLAWIMALAGFEATPVEEMPDILIERPAAPAEPQKAPPAPPTPKRAAAAVPDKPDPITETWLLLGALYPESGAAGRSKRLDHIQGRFPDIVSGEVLAAGDKRNVDFTLLSKEELASFIADLKAIAQPAGGG